MKLMVLPGKPTLGSLTFIRFCFSFAFKGSEWARTAQTLPIVDCLIDHDQCYWSTKT